MHLVRKFTLAAALAAPLLIALPASADTDAQGFERVFPDQIVWKDQGHGVQMAVISGDPTKPGIYVVRVKFPPHTMSAPHYHAEDRYAVVLKGTWYTGTSADWDPEKTVGLPPGSFMKHPAHAIHFDGAKDEEVILQLIGIGPSSTVPIHPELGPFGAPHKVAE